jgi:protein SCO1/2
VIGRRNLSVLAALALTAVLAAGCTSSHPSTPKPSGLNDQPQTGTYDGVGMDPAQPRPSFTLTDAQGKPFAFGTRTAGHPTLLYFGYTNCPDICPTTLADIHNALAAVPVALQKQVDVVFVSTDVKHDTGPVITEWLHNFDTGVQATFVGLRGTQAQIDAAQASAHIFLAEDDGQTHSTQVLLFGHDDYAHVQYVYSGTGGNEAKQMAHDLPIVARS